MASQKAANSIGLGNAYDDKKWMAESDLRTLIEAREDQG